MMFLSLLVLLTGFSIVFCIRWLERPARVEVTASDNAVVNFLRTLKNTIILNPDHFL